MTSKNCCSDFLRSAFYGIKQRIWLLTAWSVTLFLTMPLAQSMSLSGISTRSRAYDSIPELVNGIWSLFPGSFSRAYLTTVAAGVAGILFAFVAMSFVNSRPKCDFYLSQPVKRGKLMCENITGAYLTFLIPYIAALLLTVGITALMGYGEYIELGGMLKTLALDIMLFTTAFGLCSFWNIVCGNTVIALLCSAYSGFALTAGVAVLNYSFGLFWNTYDGLTFNAGVLSPIYPFIGVAAELDGTNWWIPLLIHTGVAVAMIVASVLLFRIRPAEKAGKALAFDKVLPIVKYPLSIMAGYLGHIMFSSTFNFSGAGVVGFLMISFLAFITINVLEKFDFKNILHGMWKYGIMAAAWLIFIGILSATAGAYDAYVPQRKNITSATVSEFNCNSANLLRRECDEITDPSTLDLLHSLSEICADGGSDGRNGIGFTVTYTVAGNKCRRAYTVSADETDMRLIGLLLEDDAFTKACDPAFLNTDGEVRHLEIYNGKNGGESFYVENGLAETESGMRSIEPVLTAIRSDVLSRSAAEMKSSDIITVVVLDCGGNAYANIPIYGCYDSFRTTWLYDFIQSEEPSKPVSDVVEITVEKRTENDASSDRYGLFTYERRTFTDKAEIEQIMESALSNSERGYSPFATTSDDYTAEVSYADTTTDFFTLGDVPNCVLKAFE